MSDGSAADTFNAAALAADAACRRDRGVSFHRLDASAARQFLSDAAAGHIAASVPLAQWFDQQVNPLLIEACFSGPIYEGFNNRVFWKVFGHA